jgi:hypothetical protein
MIPSRRKRPLSSSKHSNCSGSTRPSIQCVLGIMGTGREADYACWSSAKIKNVLSSSCTPSDAFTVWCLIKKRGDFTVMFTDSLKLLRSSRILLFDVVSKCCMRCLHLLVTLTFSLFQFRFKSES